MFVVCDGVLIVRKDVDCVVANVRAVFGSTSFVYIVFGEMLSERWTLETVVISPMNGDGFEFIELRLRRYSDIFPFGTLDDID